MIEEAISRYLKENNQTSLNPKAVLFDMDGVLYDSMKFHARAWKEIADEYAADSLIDPDEYERFIKDKVFSLGTIKAFADSIDRDPGIVLGRLQNDGLVRYDDCTLQSLRHKYRVKVSS